MFLEPITFTLTSLVFFYLKVMGTNAFPPPLSPEREKELFHEARNGNEKARGELIEHNLRLVAHIIKKYYTSCKDEEDLLSIGTIGLIKAIDTFDIDNGTKFATYAGKCLQNEILMYFRSQKKLSLETSINDALEYDKDGNPLTYMDIVAVDEDIVDIIDIKTKSETALKAIKICLNERERKIIVMRYGLSGNQPQTQREVAKSLDISRSYVSRIEKSAIEKINNFMKKPSNFI